MTDTLTIRRLTRLDDNRFRRPLALLEAIEVDELIVIPGVDALLDAPGEFSLRFDASIALSGLLRKHAHRVGVMKRMIVEEFDETPYAPTSLRHIPICLPVRALQYIVDDDRWRTDPSGRIAVQVAFAFVAVHALTDPTDCGTASRSLTLRPRPLHDDRALLRSVLAGALAGMDSVVADQLRLYISKASAFFAVRDEPQPAFGAAEAAPSTLLDYNPDALREACRAIGWDPRAVRIAARSAVR
ncbi:hypothetical protein AAFP30_16515 [Gordonia sp. CPCC 205515]|uniref:hypothetical protein n=1 Tax=Gordonia sp. CPCC 205515 TaxID=3140791 RepID=UPI003AF405A8